MLPVRAAGKISREVSLKKSPFPLRSNSHISLLTPEPQKKLNGISRTYYFFYCAVHIFDKGQMHREGEEKCIIFFLTGTLS